MKGNDTMFNLDFNSNSKLLAEFSRQTGIRDGVVEQVVADMSNPMRDMGVPITTTATAEEAYVLSMDTGVGSDRSAYFNHRVNGNWDKPSEEPPKDFRRDTYSRFRGLFNHSKIRFPDMQREPVQQNKDETDWRMMYEGEWKFADLVEKDGWIPKEEKAVNDDSS